MWENNVVTSNHVQASNGGLVVRRVVIMAVAVTENIVPVAVQRSHLNFKGLDVSAGAQRRGGKQVVWQNHNTDHPLFKVSMNQSLSAYLPACLSVSLSLSLSRARSLCKPLIAHSLSLSQTTKRRPHRLECPPSSLPVPRSGVPRTGSWQWCRPDPSRSPQ